MMQFSEGQSKVVYRKKKKKAGNPRGLLHRGFDK